MAETKRSVRNVTGGIRGLNTMQGYRDLAPGELAEGVELSKAEYDSAKRTGYFEFGAAAEKEPEPAPPPPATPPAPSAPLAPPPPSDELDKMSNDDLRNTVKVLTGKDAPEASNDPEKDRVELLKLARGQA
jgi:hypothetical protein